MLSIIIGFACLFIVSSYSSNIIYTNIFSDINNNRMVIDNPPKTSAAPTFSIDSPSNYSLFGKIPPNYSLTITAGIGNFTWYGFGGVNSTPVELEGIPSEYFEAPFNQTKWNSLSNGTAIVRFYVNNSLGEIGYLDAIIRIDILDPIINIIAPSGGYFNSTPPDYTIEISDPNLNTTWYTLNANQTKHVFTSNGTIDDWQYVNDGAVTLNFYANDTVGNEESSSVQIVKDVIAPTGSVIINGGDTWTNSTSVSLSLTYGDVTSGVLEVRYRNDGSSWTSWETPGATRAWTLTDPDGTNTVYFEVKDNASLISQFTDTIILDIVSPTGSIIVNGGDMWTNTTSVSLSLTYGDVTSGVLEVRYSNDGSSWTSWETPGAIRAWTLTDPDGTNAVYFEVKDNASLISQFTDTIILDTVAPTGSITINGGDTWANTTSVSLSLTYDDTTSGVLEVRYSNDGISWTSWEALGGTRAWNLVGVDGSKTVYYEVKDNASLISQFSDSIILDTTAPTGSVTINGGDTWTSSTSVSLSLTYGDITSGVLEVRYSNDGSSWTAWEAPGATRAWTLLSGDGTKTVYYEVKDNASLISQYTDTIGLDTTNPIIIINNPINNTYYNSPPPISITLYEPNPSVPECTYLVSGHSLIILTNNTEVPLDQDIWELLPEGEFQIEFTSFDIFGHRTDLKITLYKDTKVPTIEITLPVNNTYWNSAPYINVTAVDPNLDAIWYSVNNFNFTLESNAPQQIDTSIWLSLQDQGHFVVKIYANDSFNHLNDTYILNLYKDVVAPTLIINSPLNNTYHKVAPIINVLVNDTYFDSLWYRVGLQNVPLTNNSNLELNSSIWENLFVEGSFIIFFYANDSAGNLNDLFILDLNKDIRNPAITINYPNPIHDLFGDPAPDFEISINELNLNQTWYMLYNLTWNSLNYSFNDLTGKFDQLAWEKFGNGNLTIRFYANDTLNNLAYEEVIIRKNIDAPIITILDPPDNKLFGIGAPNITQINKTGLELNTTWYTLDGGTTNFTFFGSSVVVNQAAWDNYGFGDVTITFYINDTIGKIGFDQITLRKDPNPPAVTITFTDPSNNSYCATEPSFNITVYEPNIASIWYRVGSTNITVNNNTIIVLNDTIWNSLPQGKFTIEIFAVDVLGYLNDSITLTFYKDTLAPSLVINQPNDGNYYNSPPPINITVYDPNFVPVSFTYTFGLIPIAPITLYNNTEDFLNQTVWNSLPQGEFLVSITAKDTFDHVAFIVLTLYKDTIAPAITINSPVSNTYWNLAPYLNATAVDPNLDTIWYSVDNVNFTLQNNMLQQLDNLIWIGLTEGTFTIEFYANDTFGKTSTSVSLILIKDITIPLITIISPQNNTYYSDAPTMNIIANDTNIDAVWYSVNGNNIPLSGGPTQLNTFIWDSLGQGEFEVFIFANDSASNLNNSFTLTLYKDTLAPFVIVNSPLNNSYWNSYPIFNVAAYDPNLFSISYKILTYVNVWALVNNTDVLFDNITWDHIVSEGLLNIQIIARDTLGNVNDSITLTIYRDKTDPEITINLPQPNDIFGETAPSFDISITEENFNKSWYTLIGEGSNFTLSGFTGTINQTAWDTFGNETVVIRFYANDTATNLAYEEVIVRKNLFAPVITINSPGDNDLFGITAPDFVIYKSGSEINSTWYTIDNGVTNYTFIGLSGAIDQSAWNVFGSETITLKFYINDSLGKISTDEVIIRKDPDMPIISVNSPYNQTAFASTPFINLNVTDQNLHKVWYMINTITIDITDNLTQYFDLLLWNNLPQGQFIINLFANDTVGNCNNFCHLNLSKDTIGPNITIIQPTENKRVDRIAPYFELSFFDVNGIDSCWYMINGNTTVTKFESEIDKIDQNLWENLWDSLPQDSIVTIRFYSNDTLGNVNYREVNLIIDKPIDLSKLILYPLGFLFPVIGLAAMVPLTLKLTKTRYYKSLINKDKKKLRNVLITAGFFLSLMTLYLII